MDCERIGHLFFRRLFPYRSEDIHNALLPSRHDLSFLEKRKEKGHAYFGSLMIRE